ncbi:MAG: bifunctional phosphopantothenoylcysteine decarboxylase/phosphopantothenate--cysteine ligase CoaBC [Rhodospirillaceae bacterium]|nr:bifunctional phosphopantothenoylcysteine decarboxylase/phosphopantothenate--cysteine ligase CoaBC [Rhodospirillaceae bacterium]|tara:strand:- start:4873 stop:6072 length:1200 start_codon:yes stop_codon:yes gene_type:complete
MLHGKSVLLIISGGIAAYKSLELIRLLRKNGLTVRCILTDGGAKFITPLSVAALTENKVFTDLFSLTDEAEMGHISLSRETDLLLVAPASANILAKMAQGLANDLASTVLLATDKPVMIAPAMNVRMWQHEATQNNISILSQRGVLIVGPDEGDMACGEYGPGRLADTEEILRNVKIYFGKKSPLADCTALVTSGPTHEPIDPVRYIANRSSGRQGHAIAAALANKGAKTTLISGPTSLPDPAGVKVIKIETAQQMLTACQKALPADVMVCAAAVADFRMATNSNKKIKKSNGKIPVLEITENPDVLATISKTKKTRPKLLIGFAAETHDIIPNAQLKLKDKKCDWLLANDVSEESGTFGGDNNTIHLVTADSVENWPQMTKNDVAKRLAERIASALIK